MKNTLLHSSVIALLVSGNLQAGEPSAPPAGQQPIATSISAFSETIFDTGYGYRGGGYGYPYRRGGGYPYRRGGGYRRCY